ncbi:DUF3347 domain-containing protein [Halocola ammonii]
MKSRTSFFTILFALAFFTFTSCSEGGSGESDSNDESTKTENTEASSKEKSKTEEMLEKLSSSEYSSEDMQSDSYAIVTAYLTLKKSLVSSNAEFAQVAGTNLAEKIEDNEDLAEVKTQAEEISNLKDIEKQRELFHSISQEMYTFLKQNPIEGKKLYHQFCPMAFDNQGAHWISESKEIRNPYFGDKMMKCGKTEEEL